MSVESAAAAKTCSQELIKLITPLLTRPLVDAADARWESRNLFGLEADLPNLDRNVISGFRNGANDDLAKVLTALHRFQNLLLSDGFTDELVERIEARQANKGAAPEELDGTPKEAQRNMVLRVSQRCFSKLMS